ncbi:unnamed protein product [Lepeophtheirus salmonis]|uniref:(salmon louse) hypothetical protein n=1 Tax=Lepeophtheirus salmonis TaxID=72036 RepID=A0A7R8CH51_LEPSM|nr:unnamed protein product [Lepeophtheirus salmonis]CAF2816283.1 unnamed protein product [Lepeophtheirus salmonis]
MILSSKQRTGEIEATQLRKSEIIMYYNKTKDVVYTMDKMLNEYNVNRRTMCRRLAFFYYMIDVTTLASYIIYRENNQGLRKKDQRRKFLNNLARQLCMHAIKYRSSNWMVMRNHYPQAVVEMVLGSTLIIPSDRVPAKQKVVHGSRGATPNVGN